MSTTPPPAFPPPDTPDAPDTPNPPEKKRTNTIIIGATAAIIAAVVATGIIVVQTRDHDDSKPATTASSTPDTGIAAAATEDSEPTYTTLDADSFSMTLKTKSRQCFGSAGCNVTVEPDLTYTGLGEIDPDAVYEITYEIRGDESGPVIQTATLSNQTSLNYRPSVISTASASTKVSVEITDVTAQE